MILVLLFLGSFVQGPAPSVPSTDPIQILINNTIASCGHDCWVRLHASNGGPGTLINNYKASPSNGPGRTANNFDGAPNDPWTNSDTPGSANVGSGNDAAALSFSAPGIRSSDGKMVAVGTSGHAAGAVSTVFTFSLIDAATSLNASGPGGSWTMPVKPARFLGCSDARPSWQPQQFGDCAASPAGPVGWTFTNPDGQQMPIACHAYWSNLWIPNSNLSIWSGYFCGYNGGNTPGGTGYYDDAAQQVHFPTLVASNTTLGYGFQSAHTALPPGGMNDLDGCYYEWTEGTLFKWCNLTGVPTQTGVGGTGIDVAGSNTQGWMIPDPGNPTTRRWFLQQGQGACGSCLLTWKDTGVSPFTSFSYSHTNLLNAVPSPVSTASLSTAYFYDSALNAILVWPGAKLIYKIADATTGQLSTNTANWQWSTYAVGANGVTPPFASNSGAPPSCASLEPNYHAIVCYDVDNSTNTAGEYLYVK